MRARFAGLDGFGVYDVDLRAGSFKRVEGEAETLLIPGFADIHIHGAFGIDFMTASRDQMLELCERLAGEGYESFLPTTVTAPAADVKSALANLPDHPMIAGFHLEGPFISPKHPGAQPPRHMTTPADAGHEWRAVLDDPRLRAITLAPELPGALDLIQRLSARGVICSIGHTDATYEQCAAAMMAGARHMTHTFNAMRPLHHREPGAVGFALTRDDASCELIYDRLHVSPEVAGLLAKNKPEGRLIAVSDSSLATGLPDGEIEMWGHRCVISTSDLRQTRSPKDPKPPIHDDSCGGVGGRGRSVTIKGSAALAGSAITLLHAFRNLYEDFGPETAISACCLNPRQALKPPIPSGEGLRGEGRAPSTYLELDRSLQIVGFHRADNR